MKRYISFLLVITCLFSIISVKASNNIVYADELEEITFDNTEARDFEGLIPNQSFIPDSVIVSLIPGIYDLAYEFSSKDFPELTLVNVKNLTKLTNERLLKDPSVQEEYIHILKLELEDQSYEGVLKALGSLNKRSGVDILDAEPNYIMEIEQTNLPSEYPSTSSTYVKYLQKMGFPNAWNYTTGSSQIKVAIIDEGIYQTPQVYNNLYETGFDVDSGTWSSYNIVPNAYGNGHGTKCASIIGATANDGLIAGTNWNISLVSFRMNINSDHTFDTDNEHFINAFTGLNNADIPIASMSVTWPSYSSGVKNAINNYYGLLVCSSGNSGYDLDIGTHKVYPACYYLNNVLCVLGTVDYPSGEKIKQLNDGSTMGDSGYASNYGVQAVDVGACWYAFAIDKNGSVIEDWGTSMATPYVAGLAALILAAHPLLSASEIKNIIKSSVDQLDSLSYKCNSGGRINAYSAMIKASTYHNHTPFTFSGDVNNDGKHDIIELRTNSSYNNTFRQISVLMGNSNGTLGKVLDSYQSYNDTSAMITNTHDKVVSGETYHVGDVNGDGNTDFIVQYLTNGKMSFAVYLGQNDGSFQSTAKKTVSTLDMSSTPYKVFCGNFNDDSRVDIVIHASNISGKRANYCFKGQSTGYMSSSATYSYSDRNYIDSDPVFKADVNGDGLDDLVVHWANSNLKRQLLVYKGLSSGSFATPVNISTTNSADSSLYESKYSIGDFNGDGKDDFLVLWSNTTGSSSTRNLLLYPGTSNCQFNTGVQTYTSQLYSSNDQVYANNVNGIGGDEAIIINSGQYGSYDRLYSYTCSSNTFSFVGSTNTVNYSSTNHVRSVITDVDGDGKDDAVMLYCGLGFVDKRQKARIQKGTSSGLFVSPSQWISCRFNLCYFYSNVN